MDVTETLVHPELERQSSASRPTPPVSEFKITRGKVSVYRTSADVPSEIWRRVLSGHSKDHRYYAISEETLAGQFDHAYLVMHDIIGARLAVQPIFLAKQDILNGLPARVRALFAWPRRFFPSWLWMDMLVAGCSAGNGALDCTEPWAVEMLIEGLAVFARQSGVSVILLKDFPSLYRDDLKALKAHGYRRIPSMPGCVIDFNFRTFDEYRSKILGRNMRHKFNKTARMPSVPMEVVSDITPIATEIHALYMQTHERSKMRFECLTPEFFARLGREMPESARFFLWRVDGRLAAFALCLVHDGTMHHLNIGFDYAVSLDRQLYYTTMKDLFEWCLAQGLKRYYTGQLNYHPKLHLRMKLAPLDLYSRHTSALVNPLYRFALGFLQPVRHDPLIRQFPNAVEL
jgi:Acetyltransferase (GNAT) domain